VAGEDTNDVESDDENNANKEEDEN